MGEEGRTSRVAVFPRRRLRGDIVGHGGAVGSHHPEDKVPGRRSGEDVLQPQVIAAFRISSQFRIAYRIPFQEEIEQVHVIAATCCFVNHM